MSLDDSRPTRPSVRPAPDETPPERPALVRKFSSQFPAAEPNSEPAWGIVAATPEPCATCGRPTRFTEKAYGTAFRFCSEACLDERLELEMQSGPLW